MAGCRRALMLNAALTFPPIVWPSKTSKQKRSASARIYGERHAFWGFSTARAGRYRLWHPGLRAPPGRPRGGLALFAGVAFALASLGTWNVADPSFSHATDNPVTNAMGYPGAVFSDLAMQFFGLSCVAALVPAVIWGFLFATARGVDNLPRRAAAWFGAALLSAAIAGCVTPPDTWPLPTGLGGVFGDMVLKVPAPLRGGYPTGLVATVLGRPVPCAGALALCLWLRR